MELTPPPPPKKTLPKPAQSTTNTITTTTSNNKTTTTNDPKPYKCEIDITFPKRKHAQQCMDVLSVDDEIGDRVCKSFSVVDVVADVVDVVDDNVAGDTTGVTGTVIPAVMGEEGIASPPITTTGDGGGGGGCEEESDALVQSEGATREVAMTNREEDEDSRGVLRVNIQATEAKMLRVSISSFYDMLTVFLKCQQEFGE